MEAKKECCIDCPIHKVIDDPDPHDWFCDDDVAVVCTETKNEEVNLKSEYCSDRQEFRCITRSCRPYKKRQESNVPDWCPKLIKK